MDQRLREELEAHVEALTEENMRRGMTPEEARQAANREFGGFEQTFENYREQRGLPLLEVAVEDLRTAFLGVVRKPKFAIAAILTLALGIGSTTAVFSVVDRILFRPLPYPHDDRLVSFGLLAPIERDEFMLGVDYLDFRNLSLPFESVAAMLPGTVECDVTEQNPVRLSCALVEQTFLPTLGVEPIIGRNFTRDDDAPKAPPTLMVSYHLWKSRFGGNPDVINRTMSLDGKTVRIVGVLPANFEMPTLNPVDILLPLALDEQEQRKSAPGSVLRTFARLKAGAGVAQANASLQPWFEQAVSGAPPEFRKEIQLSVRALRERQTADSRAASWVLLLSVLAVLLIACSNVANLLLIRATSRERELAIRAALGASRWRLARQSLTESLVLGVIGGAVGWGLAASLIRIFVSIAPDGIPHLQQAGLDLRAAIFTSAVVLASTVIFGVAPALYTPAAASMTGRDQRATSRAGVLRRMLIVAEIAVSIVLLASAGPLLRSFWNLQNAAIGMKAQNVLVEGISLGVQRYREPAQQFAFFTDLESRLRRLPGVTALGLSDSVPPAGQMRSTILAAIEVAGRPKMKEGTGGPVGFRAVTPDYFRALDIPIIKGSGFVEADRLPTENSIILSQRLAQELFQDENPIGQKLRLFNLPEPGPWRTVIGVAGNVKNGGVASAADPEFYLPWKNDPLFNLHSNYLAVRTQMNPKSMAAWMRAETTALDPTLVVSIEPMTQRVSKLASGPRFNASLLSMFAGMALLLAAIGIYGVVGFHVVERTREIGVRLALGASPKRILRLMFSSIVPYAAGGAAIGILGAWFGTRLLESLLFEVRAHDPVLLGLAILLLLAVAMLATWIPARRAMRVDPVVVLRYE